MPNCYRRVLALCLALACVWTGSIAAYAQTPAEARSAALAYIASNVPNPIVNQVGGEWAVLALARGNADLPASYYDGYTSRVKQTLQNNGGVLPGSTSSKTEYSRVVIALSAIGEDVTNIGGYNLLLPLADFSEVTAQGLNGAIYALIAFDTRAWDIPAAADTQQQTTRQKLLDYILGRELAGGGFARSGTTAEADLTAMALQALAPYRSNAAAAAAIDNALTALAGLQSAGGGFGYSAEGETAESAAQAVTALASLGIDPAASERFAKPGGNPLSALLAFQKSNGSFSHTAAGTGNGQMATEQAAYALVAYDRFKSGASPLFDMRDVTPKSEIDAAKAAKRAAIQAVAAGLKQTDYTQESWSALQTAIFEAVSAVNRATTIDAINAVSVPSAGELIAKTPKWWECPPLPGWLHWILRYLLFGWIWMRFV